MFENVLKYNGSFYFCVVFLSVVFCDVVCIISVRGEFNDCIFILVMFCIIVCMIVVFFIMLL